MCGDFKSSRSPPPTKKKKDSEISITAGNSRDLNDAADSLSWFFLWYFKDALGPKVVSDQAGMMRVFNV